MATRQSEVCTRNSACSAWYDCFFQLYEFQYQPRELEEFRLWERHAPHEFSHLGEVYRGGSVIGRILSSGAMNLAIYSLGRVLCRLIRWRVIRLVIACVPSPSTSSN